MQNMRLPCLGLPGSNTCWTFLVAVFLCFSFYSGVYQHEKQFHGTLLPFLPSWFKLKMSITFGCITIQWNTLGYCRLANKNKRVQFFHAWHKKIKALWNSFSNEKTSICLVWTLCKMCTSMKYWRGKIIIVVIQIIWLACMSKWAPLEICFGFESFQTVAFLGT